MRKEESNEIGEHWVLALTHFCLCITCIFAVMYFFEKFINEKMLILQAFFVLLFGIAGFGIYLYMIPNLREVERFMYEIGEKRKKDKKGEGGK